MANPISKCIICDDILRNSLAKYCRRCGNVLSSVETRGKADVAARVEALKKAWNKEEDCFICHYSGIRLIDDDYRDPRYVTFDPLTSGKEAVLVTTSRILNDMKAGLTAEEFKTIILALGRHFADGTVVEEEIFKIKGYGR